MNDMDYHAKCDILMNSVSYKSKNSIVNLIKNLNNLNQLAIMGNSAAASIVIDIQDALKYSGMTDKQAECINLALIEGYTYAEICDMLGYKSKTAVTDFINGGVKKMIKYLKD